MSLIRQVILQDPDDNTRLGEFDNLHQAPVHINIEHHEIHEGDSHERHFDSNDADVATLNVAFKTLAGTKRAHMLFGFSSDNRVLLEIGEGGTWTTNTGTVTTVYNHNRDEGASVVMLEDKTATPAFTATDSVLQDVTIVGMGTIIDRQITYNTGTGINRSAESRSAGHEWVLKPDTTYIVRITIENVNCRMSIDLHWYEHSDE